MSFFPDVLCWISDTLSKFTCYPPSFPAWRWFGTCANTMRNNCYNYACDIKTDTIAIPGRASGRAVSMPYTCTNVDQAVQLDGLIPPLMGNKCDCPCCHRVALFICDGMDSEENIPNEFHFMRQDANGLWSQKHGSAYPTDRDRSGNVITDPATADMAPYQFCGYYCVHRKQVRIE